MRLLIVDEFHPSIFKMVEAESWEYEYLPEASREDIKSIIDNFDGLLTRSKTDVDGDLLESKENLKFIGRAGSGIENIDQDYLKSRDIELFNAPEGNCDAVGDHTLGLILGLTKNIVRASQEVKNLGEWNREYNRGVELGYQTVAIIGYGNTGGAVAKRLKSFGSKVLCYDKYKESYSDDFVIESDMDRIFEEADIITFHVPLTEETQFMINSAYFDQFKKSIYLVNTSRGEILNTKALVKGLNSGKVKGAALDVIENEKIDDLEGEQLEMFEILQKSKDVILTPHIGGWSKESHFRINEVLIEKIKYWYLLNK